MRFSFIYILSLVYLLLVACAHKSHFSDEYNEQLVDDEITSKRTVVVFLIDGLSYKTLQAQLERKNLPQIESFFMQEEGHLYKARTAFPALTFPSITSLLAETTLDRSGIYGNQILNNNKIFELEDPANFFEFNQMIQGKNIFARLQDKGLKSVSASYSFTSDSVAHLQINDLEAALAIQQKNYKIVDNKIINSLDKLLLETPVKKWPDFIFVHLIGIDFTNHDWGPDSLQVISYLQYLDYKLAPLFNRFKQASERKVVSLLTSDHGFDRKSVKKNNLQEVLFQLDPQIKIINEGRYLSLYFPSDWSFDKRQALLKDIAKNSDIDITALKQNETVFLSSKKLKMQFTYSEGHCALGEYQISVDTNRRKTCPDQLELSIQNAFYPYFVENISHFFKVKMHPDAVIIAKPERSFRDDFVAYHGGPTTAETIVPLLLHNCTMLQQQQRIPSLAELLRFL